MRIISGIARGVRGLVQRERADADLDDELHEYFTAFVEAKLSRGLSRDEAERQARAEMSSPAALKEWCATWAGNRVSRAFAKTCAT